MKSFLEKGQWKVVRLKIAPLEKEFQVDVNLPSGLESVDVKFLLPERKKFDFELKVYDLKVEAEDGAKSS